MKPITYANLWGRRIVSRDEQHAKVYMSWHQAQSQADKIATTTGIEHWAFQPPNFRSWVIARGTYGMPSA
jgi:hypothetical protein